MDYSQIEIFLLLASLDQRMSFYSKIKQDLTNLFRDEHAQKTFETKWTHSLKSNVMACFSRIATDVFHAPPEHNFKIELLSLYIDTIDRLLTHEKSSRIEEKFLEPFLVESVKLNHKL